jgi:hypothetical protein
MPAAAPRIDERLVGALSRLDDGKRPIAETHRRLGCVADELGLSRPSYEQARVILHELRARRRSPSRGEILLDIAFRTRPPEAVLDLFVP